MMMMRMMMPTLTLGNTEVCVKVFGISMLPLLWSRIRRVIEKYSQSDICSW